MISFWSSIVRSTICLTAEPAALAIVAESSGLVCLPVRAGSIGSARAAAFARCDLGGEHRPGDRLAAPQFPGPRRGPDDHTEPAAADIPAVDTDVNTGELSAAQLPKVLFMHDASNGQAMNRSRSVVT